MTECREINIKYASSTLPHPSHAHSIPTTTIAIQTRLWPVRLAVVKHCNGLLRRAGATELLRLGCVLAKSLAYFFWGRSRLTLEFEGDAGGVAVDDVDAVAGGIHAEVGLVFECGEVSVDGAENLACFRLHFAFFAGDEGNCVVGDVHAADAWIAGSGNGLEGDDGNVGDGAELGLERCEWNDETDDCAVGVADEEAFVEVVVFSLMWDQVEMREVDCWNDQRHHWILTIVLGVAEGWDVGLEEGDLCEQESVSMAPHLLSLLFPTYLYPEQHHYPIR